MTDDNKAAKALSKLGAAKGGAARAASLTPDERAAIARQAARSRWKAEGKEQPLAAQYGDASRPLKLGPIELQCYVLTDGTRILTQSGLQGAVGLSDSGGSAMGSRILAILEKLEEHRLDTKDLATRIKKPIKFLLPQGGATALGYEATILPDLCAVLVEAGQKGLLHHQQTHMADQARQLLGAFAKIGIIALVDEATGAQDFRARDALAKILERYIAKEMRPWVKTFKADFYRQIYRLNGWEWEADAQDPDARPQCIPQIVGHWTNNIVYRRLAPGVLDELQRLTPRNEDGRLDHHMHRHLTGEYGHPKLSEHLTAVTLLMKYSRNWRIFMERLDTEYPQHGATKMLPFPDDYAAPEN